MLSMMQSLTAMMCLFLTYRLLARAEGLESLGLWALLMAFGGLASTVDFSGVSALARFVARHDAEFPDHPLPLLVHTILLTGMGICLSFMLLLVLTADWWIIWFIGAENLDPAKALLPWMVAIIVANTLALGVSSALDGVMRADLRAMIVTVAALLGLSGAALLIPHWGIAGLAAAQLVQQATVILAGWQLLRRRIAGLGYLPVRWSPAIVRQVMRYTIPLNIAGLLGLLFEPLVKYSVNRLGGTLAVGQFEIASRVAMQLRGLVLSALTPLIPVFASANSKHTAEAESRLLLSNRIVAAAAVAVACVSVAATPLLALLVIAEPDPEILRMNALLAIGWSMNLLSAPAYFIGQARAILRWNILSHAMLGAVIGLVALMLPASASALFICFAVSAGLMLAAVIVVVGNEGALGMGAVARRSLPAFGMSMLVILAVCSFAFAAAEWSAAKTAEILNLLGV